MTTSTPLINIKLPIQGMSDEEFTHFCMVNKKIRIECDKYGNIIIMPPLSSYVAHCKLEVAVELRNWQRKTSIGVSCGSSTGFQKPYRFIFTINHQCHTSLRPNRHPPKSWHAVEHVEKIHEFSLQI